jgi:biopolymer transport protein ExbB
MNTLLKYYQLGGPIMHPILACSIIAGGIVLAKLWQLMSLRLDVPAFIREVFSLVERGQLEKAEMLCHGRRHPLASVCEAGIHAAQARPESVETAMDAAGAESVQDLDRWMKGIATVITILPMLGFLGTIIGLILAFENWSGKGEGVQIADLAAGIFQAMITTAGGLLAAIPYVIIYNALVGRIESITTQMTKYSNELLVLLRHHKATSTAQPKNEVPVQN